MYVCLERQEAWSGSITRRAKACDRLLPCAEASGRPRFFLRFSIYPEQIVSILYAISKISPIEKNSQSVKISQSPEQHAPSPPDCATANILSALNSVIACITVDAWA